MGSLGPMRGVWLGGMIWLPGFGWINLGLLAWGISKIPDIIC